MDYPFSQLKGIDAKPISLILLPGLDGTGLLFQPLVAALPEMIKSIVVGYPGDQPLNYEQLLPQVMDALPRSDPFIILGESFSGPLAMMAAAKRPDGRRALCHVCHRSQTIHQPGRSDARPAGAVSSLSLFPEAQSARRRVWDTGTFGTIG
jgi:pimeloyl-ACP methyl ester carboxylesterase